ncbi:hypothetical protein SCMU_23210 [Sinomonas cyclohexanicum]|uniref:Uncharacterized protein n=1 Tax=Sinomonas cyclohexanicum TaxID=322009 RepID=A0ABN6FIK8_SINCY|nr:hypothetical protein SCMU_23210 [Corynebacterium cyclohexanicum]
MKSWPPFPSAGPAMLGDFSCWCMLRYLSIWCTDLIASTGTLAVFRGALFRAGALFASSA